MKAVLFDLDGVLIDSIKSWLYAFNETLKKFGLRELSEEEFRKKCWGYSLRKSLSKFGLGEDAVEYANKAQMKYVETIEIFPNAKEVLTRVKRKFKVGLITNTPKENAYFVLDRLGLREYFEVIVTGDDVRRAKPDPEMILRACELLSVGPSETLLIGDTESDVIAARSAGCKVVGLRVKADLEIEEFSDLLGVLKV